jgi:hypothetical protein
LAISVHEYTPPDIVRQEAGGRATAAGRSPCGRASRGPGELRAAGWPALEDPDSDEDVELDGQETIADRIRDEVEWLRRCVAWLRVSAKTDTEFGPKRTAIRLNPYSGPAESGQVRGAVGAGLFSCCRADRLHLTGGRAEAWRRSARAVHGPAPSTAPPPQAVPVRPRQRASPARGVGEVGVGISLDLAGAAAPAVGLLTAGV